MNQSRMLEIVVGLFVCLGVAAVFILTLRVSDIDSYGGGAAYQVDAAFLNVGGLKPGAQVSMGGVGIGRVVDVGYDQDTYEAVVTLAIDSHYDRVPADSSASILTAGLLGEQYVGIIPGGALEYLETGDQIKFTQSALILEQVIGQFLFSQAQEPGGGRDQPPGGGRDQPPVGGQEQPPVGGQ